MMLERELNEIVASELRSHGLIVIQEMRLPPAEFDIIAFDPQTLRLANFEIKRRDWGLTLRQAMRGQLYCHFAVAVLPQRMRERLDMSEFSDRGIGLVFYSEKPKGASLELKLELLPELSDLQNRGFKRQMYGEFAAIMGEWA